MDQDSPLLSQDLVRTSMAGPTKLNPFGKSKNSAFYENDTATPIWFPASWMMVLVLTFPE